ncbi:MAG: ATP-binding protein [Rhodoferax sp.]
MRLLHELQIHQLELQLQNEELQATRAQVESTLARYTELFDFAPLPFFSIDASGRILQANLAAGRLLSTERARLINQPLGMYVALVDLDIFKALLHKLADGQSPARCELQMRVRRGTSARQWHIEASASPGAHEYRVVVQDITEKKHAEHELQQHRAALQKRVQVAERRVVEISERTLEHIGQELHDDLAQHLTGLSFLTEVLTQRLIKARRPEQQAAQHIQQITTEALAKTRLLAHGLYPAAMQDLGLQHMLEQLANNVQSVHRIDCQVQTSAAKEHHHALMTQRLQMPGSAINLLRIAQEAISNALRHGHAKHIELRLQAKAEHATLTISDDGSGMPEQTPPGLGRHTMRYRAELIGGSLNIAAHHPQGVVVTVELPYNTP